jgi:hypothetical protein
MIKVSVMWNGIVIEICLITPIVQYFIGFMPSAAELCMFSNNGGGNSHTEVEIINTCHVSHENRLPARISMSAEACVNESGVIPDK